MDKFERRAFWSFIGLILAAFISGCSVKSAQLKLGFEATDTGFRINAPAFHLEKK